METRMTTPERQASQSRLHAYWRIFFALVGVLDCSCFCYFYYLDTDSSGDDNTSAGTKKLLPPPRSCPSLEGRPRLDWPDDIGYFYRASLLLHLGFGMLCGIEMILRAKEARRIIFENQAIADFEEHIAATVAKVYRRRKTLRMQEQFPYYTLSPSTTNTTTPASNNTESLTPDLYTPILSSSESTETADRCHTARRELNTAAYIENENNPGDQKTNDLYRNGGDDTIDEAANERNILIFLRSTFRLWLPVGITCVFWLSLLPFPAYYRIIRVFLRDFGNFFVGNNGDLVDDQLSNGNGYCNMDGSQMDGTHALRARYIEILGEDTAWATLWITTCLTRWTTACEQMNVYLMSIWRRYLLGDRFRTHAQKKIHFIRLDRPKLIWFRLRRFLSIVKWIRFAGPLFRMFLKLQDQLRTVYSTFQKTRSAILNRQRRLQRPSILLSDLRRIESLHKVETTIASWPSRCSMLLDTLTKEASKYSVPGVKISSSMKTFYAEEFLRKSRERGRQITRRIQWLQGELQRNVSEFSTSEIYDSILRLSKDVSRRHLIVNHGDSNHRDDEDSNKDQMNRNIAKYDSIHHQKNHRSKNGRWYDFLHIETILSSRDYLISPRSRFSVVWRITVTNCLLLELTRLSVSWYLTQTFHLSIKQVISRLFVDCGSQREDTRRKFRFVTSRIQNWHVGLSRAIPLVPFPKESLWILCVPTSHFSKLLLLLGSALETFIDVVSFLDIFFWFFTGDLETSTGMVVPKAFFGRCILPGTLVQVMDHPTLPNVLPSLLRNIALVASELGWSRLVLWSCALVPALIAEVVKPFLAYFFRHFEETDIGDFDSSGSKNGNHDLLMKAAESFGYLPTRNNSLFEPVPPFTRVSSQSHFSSEDEDDSRSGRNITKNLLRRRPTRGQLHTTSLGGFRTPPISPKRSALRGPSSPKLQHDSSVRFAKDLSMESNWDDEDTHEDSSNGSPRRMYGSAADFDIGLSLSSHALDDLK